MAGGKDVGTPTVFSLLCSDFAAFMSIRSLSKKWENAALMRVRFDWGDLPSG